MSNARDIAMASTLALGPPRSWVDGCAAWVDSRDEQCGKPRAEGYLCARHRTVAERHLEKKKHATEKRKQQRQERLDKHGDRWRARLARVEAELERRTGMATTDRAAFGGVGARQLRTAKARGFSHSNVKRVGELIEQRKDLRQKLGIRD